MLLGCYWDVVRMLLDIIRILLDNGMSYSVIYKWFSFATTYRDALKFTSFAWTGSLLSLLVDDNMLAAAATKGLTTVTKQNKTGFNWWN